MILCFYSFQMKVLLIIIITIVLLYIIFFYYTRPKHYSGGVLFNTTHRSCGICSLVNLYEALIGSDFTHLTDVTKYNPTKLTTERLLYANEIADKFNEIYKHHFVAHGFTIEIGPNYFTKCGVRPKPRDYFKGLITSDICGMILHGKNHYVCVVILNHESVILINDGNQTTYALDDFFKDIKIDDPKNYLYSSAIVVVNKNIVLNNTPLLDLVFHLQNYCNCPGISSPFEDLLNNFFDTYKRRTNTRQQDNLHMVILSTRKTHEFMLFTQLDIVTLLSKFSIPFNNVNTLKRRFDRLILFAYSPNFDNRIKPSH